MSLWVKLRSFPTFFLHLKNLPCVDMWIGVWIFFNFEAPLKLIDSLSSPIYNFVTIINKRGVCLPKANCIFDFMNIPP